MKGRGGLVCLQGLWNKTQKRKGFSVFWRNLFRISLTTFLTRVFVVVFARGEHCMMKKACVRGTENDAGYTEQLFSLARWQRCETTFQGSTDKPSSKKHWNLHSKIHYQTACHHPNLGCYQQPSESAVSRSPSNFFASKRKGLTPGWSSAHVVDASTHPAESINVLNVVSVTVPLGCLRHHPVLRSWAQSYLWSIRCCSQIVAAVFGESESVPCLFVWKWDVFLFFFGGEDDWLKWLCPTPLGFFVVVILRLRLKLKMWPKLSNDLTSHIKLARGPILAGVYQIPST